jgi:ParB family chromosome partitioning protein
MFKLLGSDTMFHKVTSINMGGIAIPLNRVRPRLRQEVVDAIAQSFKNVGQLQPIIVRKRQNVPGYTLVAGMHRLAAAKKLNWPHIQAIIIEVNNDLEATMVEIDSNLAQVELSPVERLLAENKTGRQIVQPHARLDKRAKKS